MTATLSTHPRVRPTELRQVALAAYADAAALAARQRAEQEERRRADELRRLTTRVWERWGLEIDDATPVLWARLPGWPAPTPGGFAPVLPVLIVDEVAVACSGDGGLMIAVAGGLDDVLGAKPVWRPAATLADVGRVLAGLAAEGEGDGASGEPA